MGFYSPDKRGEKKYKKGEVKSCFYQESIATFALPTDKDW